MDETMKKLLALVIASIIVFVISCNNFDSYKQAWLDEAVEHQGFTEYVYTFSETKGTVENAQILEIYGANSDNEIHCKYICYIEDDGETEIKLLEKRVLE